MVIGGGNLRAEGDHVWIAERICPELAPAYAALRAAMGKPPAPLQVVVTGSGDVDLSLAVFSAAAPSMVVTTAAGAARLATQRKADRAPAWVRASASRPKGSPRAAATGVASTGAAPPLRSTPEETE
ncbi:MAG TPA: hypothetical protein VF912_07880 [Anaeromyxobacter sp.]